MPTIEVSKEVATEFHRLHRVIVELEAERDRYREALEKIAADSVVAPGYVRRWITLDDAQDIASEALNHDRQ